MRAYLAIFRIRFIGGLQYRAAALAGLVTQFVWGGMQLLAFSAFQKADPSAFPMPFSQMASYIWMQQAFLALFMTWFFESEVFDAISDGGIAYDLARPVDLYGRWFCQSVASRLSRTVLRCAPVLLVAFLIPKPYRMSLPRSAGRFLLFLLSAVLAVGVIVSFSMLIYISAFYTLSPVGVRVIYTALAAFLEGAVIPLPFFPAPVRRIAELLPFASMQNMPLRIYSGNIADMDAVWGITLQLFWFGVLFALGRVLMHHALRRVVVQGG